MELKDKIESYILNLNIVEKIILINVIIYLVPFILKTILFLFNISDFSLMSWFTISADFSELILKPWSLLTYGFLHGSFSHLFWNMIMFYYFGNILVNIFGDKLIFRLFLSGVVVGGFTYVLSYNIFPVFKDVSSVMIGASAGVMSVLVFLTVYNPDYRIRIVFFNIKVLYIALFLFVYDIIQIPFNNSGGHIAHIGGAIWGYYYCIKYNNGNDLVKKLLTFFKFSESKFKPKKNSFNKTNQKKVDSILDKISASGYDSLSKSEKDYLFKAGKENKK